MHISRAVVDGLRRRGIDVVRPQEFGMDEATDEEHLARAHADGRVFVTHDADFLRLDRRGLPHSGIVYCAQGSRPVGQVIAGLLRLAESGRSDFAGVIEFL